MKTGQFGHSRRFRPLALAFAGLVATAGVATAADSLRQTVSGKTIVFRISGVDVPITYRANGSMSGKVVGFIAKVVSNEPTSDRGKWWVKNGKLCQRWRHWSEGKTYCYTVKTNGNTVAWQRNDGRSGTAQIGG